ncbi:MAG: hypothetical protein KJ970_05615 [Candidatus Eisenbacteria bacterium]|uniref:Uncharacterized protein n=1 Tax=Eiseniibacteriota bacterium TaxID=2212470 RepID=A0A948W689_UNCEI|nr:hypothetical protein [Candidatus Eisenbacteria bacterium]MBU1949753.1 hypothetical protein [Candidatus Eisenbacteria bacterium]MBU2690386.1 hypothetical protein [Candidatus Eisenbacteria bacterium]
MDTYNTQEAPAENTVMNLTIDQLKDIVARAARGDEEISVALAGKWEGGEVILRPGKSDLQEKVIPMDVFFHKIVMLRDRLRVLEQKINSNKVMSDIEKVELQQYITRIYGTLTTFNVLFSQRDDQFRGEGTF